MDTRFLPRVTVLQKGQRGFGFVVQSKRGKVNLLAIINYAEN